MLRKNENQFTCLLTLCSVSQLLHVLHRLYVLTDDIVEIDLLTNGKVESQLVSEERNRKRDSAKEKDESFLLKHSMYALLLLIKKISDYSFLHLGQCIHVDAIKSFLKQHNVAFFEED